MGLSLTSTQCSRDLSTKTAPQHLLNCRYWSAGSRIQQTNQDWYNCPSTDCSLHFWCPPLRQVPATLQPEIEEWHTTNLDSMSWAFVGILPKIYQNGGVKISWSRHSAGWFLYIHTGHLIVSSSFPHHLDSWQLSFSLRPSVNNPPCVQVLSALTMWKSLQFHAD